MALDDILAGMDAVADAAIADSVHHVLQGNTARASATLDAVATGAVPPPELSGLDTPQQGASISHRVLLTLGGDGATRGWWWNVAARGAGAGARRLGRDHARATPRIRCAASAATVDRTPGRRHASLSS